MKNGREWSLVEATRLDIVLGKSVGIIFTTEPQRQAFIKRYPDLEAVCAEIQQRLKGSAGAWDDALAATGFYRKAERP